MLALVRLLFGGGRNTDYELQDGSGVFVDRESGRAYGGVVSRDAPRGGDWVDPRGQQPANKGWEGQVKRGWRS